ncbi:MAG: glycoside hydrolase family 32 protein [Paludibacteraceae bacterium]|nr:glycoside hydrolase family 32 protein [Paludibacteraceae bacterium]
MKKLFTLIFCTAILAACTQKQESEPYRSVYHHTPEANWMNDPNGMFYDETTHLWHLYYQYYPEATVWGPMHWGHSTSKDLIHWEHQPIAIYPDANGMIFSGSCVIDRNNTAGFGENAIVAIYTSADKAQHQSISYSNDGGTTFTAYEGNPVLLGDIADFRDPKVFRDEQADRWTMILACQQEVRFYGSPNLKEWTLLSRFGEGYGAHGGVWECPDLVPMGDQWVLLLNINPGGPFGGSATQYFVGNWDGTTFTCIDEPEETKWLDFGKDHYATVTWHNAPDNRIVAIGWMSNWQYATVLPTVAFRSQNTIARDLSLYKDDAGEYRIASVPSAESLACRGDKQTRLSDIAIVEIEWDGKQDALITVSNDKGEKVLMTLDAHHQTFSMDRTASGDCSFSHEFAANTTAPLFVAHDRHHVTLFIDHCSIEAFGTNGEWAMTNLVFPSEPYNRLTVEGGEATIYSINY